MTHDFLSPLACLCFLLLFPPPPSSPCFLFLSLSILLPSLLFLLLRSKLLQPCFLCSQGVMSYLQFHNRSRHGSLVSLSLRLSVVCEVNEQNCQSLKCIKDRERLEMKFKRKILSEASGILQADRFIIFWDDNRLYPKAHLNDLDQARPLSANNIPGSIMEGNN